MKRTSVKVKPTKMWAYVSPLGRVVSVSSHKRKLSRYIGAWNVQPVLVTVYPRKKGNRK